MKHRICLVAITVLWSLSVRGQNTLALTGITIFDTNRGGNWTGFFGGSFNNTHGGDQADNLYVINGGDLFGSFINHGNGPGVDINIPLTSGTYTFTVYAAGGDDTGSFGMNLFFNGNGNSPGISVSASLNSPSFFPDSLSTMSLFQAAVPGASTATFMFGSTKVTVKNYILYSFGTKNIDRVSGYSDVPDGRPDHIGQFTIEVSGCQVNVTLFSGFPNPQSMEATFKAPTTLVDYANACGFDGGFNWQQQIVHDPATLPGAIIPLWIVPNNPLPLIASGNVAYRGVQVPPLNPLSLCVHAISWPGECSLIAPPAFYDFPDGGYTYSGTYNPYPFYIPSANIPSPSNPSPPGLFSPACGVELVSPDGTTLSFCDSPADFNLSGERPTTHPTGNYVAFRTTLVGVSSTAIQGSTSCGPGSSLYCTPLGAPWTWNSTFNGTAGGVHQTGSIYPIDPGSGTGGVTITSINGLPQTPPSVTCAATHNILWPPNGKSVVVTVSGSITPGTQAIPPGGTAYAVIDEYGQVQPNGVIALGVGGSYSFGVSLIAARNGNDQDGRAYTIVVGGKDSTGNVGSCSAVVTVPHDQGH